MCVLGVVPLSCRVSMTSRAPCVLLNFTTEFTKIDTLNKGETNIDRYDRTTIELKVCKGRSVRQTNNERGNASLMNYVYFKSWQNAQFNYFQKRNCATLSICLIFRK